MSREGLMASACMHAGMEAWAYACGVREGRLRLHAGPPIAWVVVCAVQSSGGAAPAANFIANEGGVHGGYLSGSAGRVCSGQFVGVVGLRRPQEQLASLVNHALGNLQVRAAGCARSGAHTHTHTHTHTFTTRGYMDAAVQCVPHV